jgi:hypothetical protein
MAGRDEQIAGSHMKALPLIRLPASSPREKRGEGTSGYADANLSPFFTGRG